ncbi:MAG: cobalamin biosynthesis protein CobD [Deltaproteobacteria bacterium]|nr:cobalamin biosynthesis protein CobD [Candidatus Anaeroferrophillus wilburensis]MBN2889180.1 cobalamin biosynthesis protein CobD [Deltaproteobacteria bacterium]
MFFTLSPFLLVLMVAADLLAGERALPFPHPVVLVGRLIETLEHHLYPREKQPQLHRWMGVLLVLVVCVATFLATVVLLKTATFLSPLIGMIITVFIGYTTLASTGLARAAANVLRTLDLEGEQEARKALAMIVGRDTANLDRRQMLQAVVETVAENISDGIVAPLIYLIVGGVPLAMTYKAINTMDSMIGYRNERYACFGTAAARLDDLANFIPARLTGLLIVAAGWCLGYEWRAGWRTMRRDHGVHHSPNSGYPEAAMAGILGIRLGGPSSYFGSLIDKASFGEAINEISGQQVQMAISILYGCTVMMTMIGVVVLW